LSGLDTARFDPDQQSAWPWRAGLVVNDPQLAAEVAEALADIRGEGALNVIRIGDGLAGNFNDDIRQGERPHALLLVSLIGILNDQTWIAFGSRSEQLDITQQLASSRALFASPNWPCSRPTAQ
jgi:hypothetical protein